MHEKLTAPRLCLALFLLFLSSIVFAQQRTVTGKVTAEDGKPVSGATVTARGTNTSTLTGDDGSFSIRVPENVNRLVITSVGFEAREVSITASNTVNASLRTTAGTMNEVVVTGYSAQRKRDITGAVTVVKVSDLQSQPASNAQSQLQGRAAGVTVTENYVPGAAATVRIRGFASFTGNDPLYIIDGVPAGSLSSLNPADIESMQVLKDAASASVYGARASNGVIVITTKKGKLGSAKVTYDAYYGNQDPGKGFTNLLNSQEMADLTWMALKNSGTANPSTTQYGSGATPRLPDYIFAGGQSGVMNGDPLADPSKYDLSYSLLGSGSYNPYLIVPANKTGTNWFKEMSRTAPIMNHNLTVSGATEKNRYLFSFNYFDQKSILVYNFYKRYTARINTEFNIKNNIRIGENLQVFADERNLAGNNGEGTQFAMAYREQPIIPLYTIRPGDFAGSRGAGLGNGKNPVAQLFRGRNNRTYDLNMLGNMYVEVDFLKNFTARSSFGGNYNTYNYYNYPAIEYENSENNVNITYGEGFGRNRSWTWTNQLSYKNTFGSHTVSALAGTEAVSDKSRSMDGSRQNYFTYTDINFITLSSGASNQQVSGAPGTPSTLFSVFGKVDYMYNNKYLASFTIRRDGSSRFGSANRYGTFPAGSIGWRVTQESFASGIRWLNELKIRGSYGLMGNQRISSSNQYTLFRSSSAYSGYDINGNNTPVIGNYLSFIGNQAGKWETNVTANVGFDATLFNGNTDISFDVYQKKTKDLLFTVEQASVNGAAAAQRPPSFNVGSMKNTGIDLQLTQRARVGGRNGVRLEGTLTLTTYKNTVTAIAPGISFFDIDAGESGRIGGVFTRNAVGHPINSFFGYKVVGLFQSADDVAKSPTQKEAAPGRFKYFDANGDGKITDDDRVYFGDPNPKFSYGFNLSVAYSGFDLSAFFYGVAGKHSINYTRWWTDFYPSFQGGKSKNALYNSWLPSRTNTTVPIQENAGTFSTNGVPNSYYMENSSYFRLRNLQIGYSLPQSVLSRVKIDRARVYVQGTNLFTITKYTGLDPEITNFGNDNWAGIDAGVYPAVKQFIFGVNIGF